MKVAILECIVMPAGHEVEFDRILVEELKKQGAIENFNVVKGFLNLSINNEAFVQNFKEIKAQFDVKENKNQTVMVEYSSPNTNKPLHLGHIRNNLLGFSVAQILKEAGYNVIKTQIINCFI